jgi:inward rectifier potassium channel
VAQKKTDVKPPPPQQPAVRAIGVKNQWRRDIYHGFLRAPWWLTLTVIVAVYLATNALFALAFLEVDGIANAAKGSFVDAFFFSVQTMGTIGYGAMYPTTRLANVLVVAESVTSLVITALATGLVFAKFSRSDARIAFSREVTISPMDGIPTLMLRVGNERSNQIAEALMRVSMVRTEKTKEGVTFYRMYDLKLTRDRSPAFSRSWTVMHRIEPDSPLFGITPATLVSSEIEIMVSVSGIDDITMQTVHARHTYYDGDVVFGARHADILSYEANGQMLLDLTRFHDTVPTEPTEDFRYPEP